MDMTFEIVITELTFLQYVIGNNAKTFIYFYSTIILPGN